MLGFRRGLSHPGADKGIEHFAENGESGFEPFSDVRRLIYGIKSDRGHGGPPHESNGHDVQTMP